MKDNFIEQGLANLSAPERKELADILGKRGYDLVVKAFGPEMESYFSSERGYKSDDMAGKTPMMNEMMKALA